MLTLYVYSLETDKLVDTITGDSNAECERAAFDKWGGNDFYCSYCAQHWVQ